MAVGSGSISDGPGPGVFSSLGDVFRRLGEVHIEVSVEGETLSPRTRVMAAAYSLGNAAADPECYGASGNEHRFVDCDNGTVTDTVTGLIWLKIEACFEFGTWWDANAWAATLADGQCGLTDKPFPGDWRLPTKEEWNAVLSQADANGCSGIFFPDRQGTGCCGTDPCAFTNVQPWTYWSSTSLSNSPSGAWFAYLGGTGG